jgi:hypothetical protein
MAGKPSPRPNYHSKQINQPTLAGIRKPRRLGNRGFGSLRSRIGKGAGGSAYPLRINLRRRGIVPRCCGGDSLRH